MTHTKWFFQRQGCRIYDEKDRKVADVGIGYCDSIQIMERGNLIAAAPALLEVLEYLVGECDDDMDDDYNPHTAPLAKARAAIKAAKRKI